MFFLTPGAKLARKVDIHSGLYEAVVTTRGEAAAATIVPSCRVLQELRGVVSEPPTTEATRKALVRYVSALDYVQDRVELPAEFPVELLWVNSYDGNDDCAGTDLGLDRVACIFNLGVCEASLAAVAYRARRADPDALKAAARHFQLAAGYMKLAGELPTPGGLRAITCDLYPQALLACEYAMLGNAQQVLYEMTVEENGPALLLARFAAGVRDYYRIAAETCSDPDLISTCVNGYLGRPAAALADYFDVVAQSSQAMACDEAHNMAEQLTRLKNATASCAIGLKTAQELSTVKLASVTELRSRLIAALSKLGGELKERSMTADTENKAIYRVTALERVPVLVGRQSLRSASVADVLNAEPIDERLRGLEKLPSPSAAELSGVPARYTEMAASLVAAEVASLETISSHLREVVVHAESAVGTTRAAAVVVAPPSAHVRGSSSSMEDQRAIEAVRSAQTRGGLKMLRESQAQVLSLAGEAQSQVQSIESLLSTEDAEDRQLRARVHVTRPTSQELQQGYLAKLLEIRNNMEKAANADKLVERQINYHAPAISALSGVDVTGLVPPSAASQSPGAASPNDHMAAIAADLETLLTTAKQMLASKDDLVQELEKVKHLENPIVVTAKVTAGPSEASDCKHILEQTYGALQKRSELICSDMKHSSQTISDTVVRLKVPVADTGASRAQSTMNEVYKHQAAAIKFSELASHLESGGSFYAKEQDVLLMLKGDVEGFCVARGTEAIEIGSMQPAAQMGYNGYGHHPIPPPSAGYPGSGGYQPPAYGYGVGPSPPHAQGGYQPHPPPPPHQPPPHPPHQPPYQGPAGGLWRRQ